MKTLSIDIETFSGVDLKRCGVYRYCESPDFKVLLFSYSVDGGKVHTVDLEHGESVPQDIIDVLTDENVEKLAFNANFERVCLSRWLRDMGYSLDPFADNHFSAATLGLARFLNPASWRCSMIWCAYMGLPLSLEGAGVVLGLKSQKMVEGKRLIKKFSVPQAQKDYDIISLLDGGQDSDWALFKEYNRRDVETELEIQQKLSKFPVPASVWAEYAQDQEINDLGVQLDMTLVRNAITMDERARAELNIEMKSLTNLANPNSVMQMKKWLGENGLEVGSLGKKTVAELIKAAPPKLRQALEIRQSLAKSSVAKYTAMENCVCADGRIRGMFQFYGANRSGRWSGKLCQLQNLPQNHLSNLEQARELVRNGDHDAINTLFDGVLSVLSELIRTALVPADGKKFAVADFSAIEARIIAWFAGEDWRNEVFRTHGKIYEASAAQMFNVPIETITKMSPLRQKGKYAELGLGYGGSVGALKNIGALEMGLTEGELKPLVDAWRAANPNIVNFWRTVESAALRAVRNKTSVKVNNLTFAYQSGILFITLPSGRRLTYVKPRIGVNQFGMDALTYEGGNDGKKWGRVETFGGKLVENIVQGTARDVLAFALSTFRHCAIVAHVHDEIIIEADKRMSLPVVLEQMSRVPTWAEGLVLRADGYECDFYRKD